ncbi:MAG: hypothetical protein ABFR36_01710 [Acidobacteriota bacterium]
MKRINVKVKIPSGKKGSTFIETLIAISILMFVLAGILSMTTIQMKTNFNQINHTRAVKLAEEALERKMRENFDTLTGETNDYDTISDFPQYSRTVSVTTIDSDNKDITVRVTWKERQRSSIQPISLNYRRTR